MKVYTPKEQKANRKKWVKALRSGKYKQGAGRLRSEDDKFCCLGVLCDLAGLQWVDRPRGYGWRVPGADLIVCATPPPEVMNFVGLRNDGGVFAGNSNSLIRLNDEWKVPFAEIADIIESEPEGLFVTASES